MKHLKKGVSTPFQNWTGHIMTSYPCFRFWHEEVKVGGGFAFSRGPVFLLVVVFIWGVRLRKEEQNLNNNYNAKKRNVFFSVTF